MLKKSVSPIANEDRGVHAFPKVISPKVNVIVLTETLTPQGSNFL